MTAVAYGREVRCAIETNSRKRMSPGQTQKTSAMLTEEHDVAKKATVREITALAADKKAEKVIKARLKGDPSRRQYIGKGRTPFGKGGQNSWKTGWRQNWKGDQRGWKGQQERKGKGKEKKTWESGK